MSEVLFDDSTRGDLYRVTAPHFVAGLVVEYGIVERAAPVIRYLRDWPIERVEKHCQRKRWSLVLVRSDEGQSQKRRFYG